MCNSVFAQGLLTDKYRNSHFLSGGLAGKKSGVIAKVMEIVKLHMYMYILHSRGAILVVQFTPTAGLWIGSVVLKANPAAIR